MSEAGYKQNMANHRMNWSINRFISPSTQFFQHHIPTAFFLLAVFDFALLVAAFYLGVEIRFIGAHTYYAQQEVGLFGKGLVFAGFMLGGLIAFGNYQRHAKQSLEVMAMRLVVGLAIGMIPLIITDYVSELFFLGRGVLALSSLLAFVMLFLSRLMFERVAEDELKLRVLVLGSGKNAETIKHSEDQNELKGLNVLGYIAINEETSSVGEDKIIFKHKPLIDIAADFEADQIVLAVDDRRNSLPVQEILDCKMSGIEILDTLTFYERETGQIRLDMLQPSWLFLSEGFRQTVMRRLCKRILDLGSCMIMLPFVAPFMLLTALSIWVESGFKGPILYRQVRVGENNKTFHIYKFRSMYTDAEKNGAQWATKNDSRITRVGAVIRKTRLDELPQLFNVLRGDMSFVGPRPERPEFTRDLEQNIPYYSERHRVKPGLTGWAQIRFSYGASEEDALQKLQYDLYYVKNYGILMDILILLQTAEVVLLGKGAH